MRCNQLALQVIRSFSLEVTQANCDNVLTYQLQAVVNLHQISKFLDNYSSTGDPHSKYQVLKDLVKVTRLPTAIV